MLAVLRRRDFFLLWLSGLISVAGDWVLMIALPYYVYVTTGSTLATAGMTAAELAPAILLSSFTGVFADRWNRKHILVVANLLQAARRRLRCCWSARAGCGSCTSSPRCSRPPRRSRSPPSRRCCRRWCRREQLVQANALNALNNRLGRLAGVPLGAALLSWWGLDAVVVVDARDVPGRRRAGRADRRTGARRPTRAASPWSRTSGASGPPACGWYATTAPSPCCSWSSG